jgi:hypothetical protein
MTLEHLTQVLTKHFNARKEGSAYLVPADADVSLLVALEGETLTVQRVARLDVSADPLLLAETHKGECYAFMADAVLAAKTDKSDQARRERGAGFLK